MGAVRQTDLRPPGKHSYKTHLHEKLGIVPVPGAQELNSKLAAFYGSKWSTIQGILNANPRLSWPLLIKVPPGYLEAKTKLMVVGQQPYEWGFKDGTGRDAGWNSCADLMSQYERFELGKKYVRSPFWQAAHKLQASLNPESSTYSFVWTNVLAIDRQNGRPGRDVENALIGMDLLKEEIKLTRPDVVVFFTGYTYDGLLRSMFKGVSFSPLEKKLDRVEHAALPRKAFRTYHPAYLRRSGNWTVLDEICKSASSR